MDFNGNKGFRLLAIYERLNKGETLNKSNLAQEFQVTEKTIQRDIEDLRTYFSEMYLSAKEENSIQYDRKQGGYYLIHMEREWLTSTEVLAICKVLLESRAFCKEEMNTLIAKLLNQVTPSASKQVIDIIRNEQFCYVPLHHGKELQDSIWELSKCIRKMLVTEISYMRKDGVCRTHLIKPVAIMFSEYYFYVIAYMADGKKDYPTVFRIDRIKEFKSTKETFYIPYKDKFSDGEFRNRVQFMYSGELRRVRFQYKGPSIESVLDRLPTAEVLREIDGVYEVQVEVYGNGIDMWIRSQGDMILSLS